MGLLGNRISYKDYQQSIGLAIDCNIIQNEQISYLHNVIRSKDEEITELRNQISKLKGQDNNGKD